MKYKEYQWSEQMYTNLKHLTNKNTLPSLEKEKATHSSVLAWRIPGTGEPGGLPSMGSRRVWSDLAAAAWNNDLKDGCCLLSRIHGESAKTETLPKLKEKIKPSPLNSTTINIILLNWKLRYSHIKELETIYCMTNFNSHCERHVIEAELPPRSKNWVKEARWHAPVAAVGKDSWLEFWPGNLCS